MTLNHCNKLGRTPKAFKSCQGISNYQLPRPCTRNPTVMLDCIFLRLRDFGRKMFALIGNPRAAWGTSVDATYSKRFAMLLQKAMGHSHESGAGRRMGVLIRLGGFLVPAYVAAPGVVCASCGPRLCCGPRGCVRILGTPPILRPQRLCVCPSDPCDLAFPRALRAT